MRSYIYTILLLPAFIACTSERRYFDEDEASGNTNSIGEKTLESRFTSGFDVKNNEFGVPEASSSKSSPFQNKIDSQYEQGKGGYMTSNYAGINNFDDGRKSFGASGKEYSGRKVFSGSKTSSFTRDEIPAFMQAGRGIERVASTSFSGRADGEGRALLGLPADDYSTNHSRYSSADESGYIESRRNNTPDAKIQNSKDYMQRTIDETRTMLGRDDYQSDQDKAKIAKDSMVDESEIFTGEFQ